MMPLSDDNSRLKSTPIITYLFIAMNVIVFLLETSLGEAFIMNWSFVPSRFTANPVAEASTVFTSMFMHAGWPHLIGNMLYLWIFGDNVEDLLGKTKYIFLYLLSGIAATFSQMFFDASSSLPHLGASGAIGGILGAYILLFPKTSVNVLVGRVVTQMSALAVIGIWFLLQFVSSVGAMASAGEETGGVAYMAHIGGFVAGLALAFVFKGRGEI